MHRITMVLLLEYCSKNSRQELLCKNRINVTKSLQYELFRLALGSAKEGEKCVSHLPL